MRGSTISARITRKGLKQKSKKISEGSVLIGELHRGIGNNSLGVKGNSSSVSFGGGLLREILSEKEHFLLNWSELTHGGP